MSAARPFPTFDPSRSSTSPSPCRRRLMRRRPQSGLPRQGLCFEGETGYGVGLLLARTDDDEVRFAPAREADSPEWSPRLGLKGTVIHAREVPSPRSTALCCDASGWRSRASVICLGSKSGPNS
jgi:hypothetical protein